MTIIERNTESLDASVAAGILIKLVELELALLLANTERRPKDFETRVREACQASDLTFLFNLPAQPGSGIQRVAAAAWCEYGEDPAFAFIMLNDEGTGIAVDAHCDCIENAELVAATYFDLKDA